MILILFRRSHFRVTTGTPMKLIATAGPAYGQWHKKSHTFIFRLPPGVCEASATFTGTSGIHKFQFKSGFCQAIHIPWEDVDYDYDYDYYLLARKRSRLGQGDFRVSDCPFQRRQSITGFYNPTRPAYLVWGAVPQCQRRYDPEEYRSLDNRHYHPPCESSTSPLCRMHRTWRGCSPSSRSRSESPDLQYPSPPQVSPPSGTPSPPYSPSVGKNSLPGNSRGPSLVRSKTCDLPSILAIYTPQWKKRFEKVPDLHKRFLMGICSLIVNTAELAQFAKGCGISDYTVSRAAMDNLGNDGECIEQALCR